MSAHSFHPSVLREYDIRGVVGKTLSRADAEAAGRAFGTVLRRRGGRTVCLGYDGRLSSPEFAEAAAQGLASTGLDVLRIGLGPSPMLYFSVYRFSADGGFMVTGSHNPPDQNGFKMMISPRLDSAGAFFGEAIRQLGALAAAGDFASGAGKITDRAVLDAYVDSLVAEAGSGGRAPAAAWDAGNGAAGQAMERLVQRLGGRNVTLYAEIDGRFPNHHPDPTVPANLADLRATVTRDHYDLGLAFDGDGDRIGAVDGKGRVVWADQLMILFARDLLAAHPGSTVISDVKASDVLFNEIARAGGRPVMYKTGHSLIKAKMKELGAPLAGEMSGHIFFSDRNNGYDDGLYAAARIIRILRHATFSMADFLDALPRPLNTPELRFACPAERKEAVIAEVDARLARTEAEVNRIDGLRVRTGDGWWLLRASNTQDVLVARVEAADQAGLTRLKQNLAEHLAASGLEFPESVPA
jgi:phosphomannomutase